MPSAGGSRESEDAGKEETAEFNDSVSVVSKPGNDEAVTILGVVGWMFLSIKEVSLDSDIERQARSYLILSYLWPIRLGTHPLSQISY